MFRLANSIKQRTITALLLLAIAIPFSPPAAAQAQAPLPRAAAPKASPAPAKPKLVVLLVVDQMRGDYVDKFLGQWTGGLNRPAGEGGGFAAGPFSSAP